MLGGQEGTYVCTGNEVEIRAPTRVYSGQIPIPAGKGQGIEIVLYFISPKTSRRESR